MHGIVRLAAALALAASLLTAGTRAADTPLTVVAAENFYGDIARQIGGDRVAAQPANVSFQDRMLGELDALEKALGRPNS
jgi:ABC-type Zn uptake system ZnuABC Zn-binding protein ZnuA